jgi:ferredoxin
MRTFRTLLVTLALFLALTGLAFSEFRFPMPEFESGYQHPQMHLPLPKASADLVDMAVLLLALSLTAYAVLRRRSRRAIFMLAIFSVIYLGFWRKGCVCSVGSIQNVLAATINGAEIVPVVVLVFFILPLLFALFFGRVFCASVCPLGALQEIVAIRPIQLSRPLEAVLSIIPYAYLGLTVLSLATGAGFLICRYDPFVGFFRLGASFNMFIVGGIFLLAGIFIGRPYCRFFCPYGVLLSWMSRFSKWHVTITPAECVQCRLCEDSCPYGAIKTPTPEHRPITRREGAKRVGILLLITPLIIAVGASTGAASHEVLARLHPTVQLAGRIAAEERGDYSDMTVASEAFRSSDKTIPELYQEARAAVEGFRRPSAWFGAFLGLVVAGKLIAITTVRRRTDYEADRGACVSCGRCFAYCPVEKENAVT